MIYHGWFSGQGLWGSCVLELFLLSNKLELDKEAASLCFWVFCF